MVYVLSERCDKVIRYINMLFAMCSEAGHPVNPGPTVFATIHLILISEGLHVHIWQRALQMTLYDVPWR